MLSGIYSNKNEKYTGEYNEKLENEFSELVEETYLQYKENKDFAAEDHKIE